MAARLTKRGRWCKGAVPAALLAMTATGLADPQLPAQTLRDCIAAARGAAAVAACEKTQQAALQARIERWTAAIRKRVHGRDRVAFDRNTQAWQTFFETERVMLERTLKDRHDGMGATLYPGAITRLYEERARQLREHLHNLSYVGRSPGNRR